MEGELLTGSRLSNHILWIHEQQEQQEVILEQTRQNAEKLRIEEERIRVVQQQIKSEEQRLQAEKAAREEQQRLRELAAKKIPPLSPVQPPKPPPTQPSAPSPAVSGAKATPTSVPLAQPSAVQPKLAQPVNGANPQASSSLFTSATAPRTIAPTPVPATKPAAAPALEPAKIDPKRERAVQIHKNLKELRVSITAQGDQSQPLRSKAGDLRRELRKCVGQLSFDRKGNNAVVSTLKSVTTRDMTSNRRIDCENIERTEGSIGKSNRQPNG